jgi:hypothetical protein
MEIIITNHARDQYRERVAKWDHEEISDDEIDKILKNVVKKRLKIQKETNRFLNNAKRRTKTIKKKAKKEKPRRLPGNAFEFYYDGIGVAGTFREGKVIVLTCLGDEKLMQWYRNSTWEKRSYCKTCY